MTLGIDQKRLCEWLVFCQKNASEHGEIIFDETGMIHPTVKPNKKLPFDPASRWTYYQYARNSELLVSHAGTNQRFYRFALSDRGKTFIAENHKGWWATQIGSLKSNVLTILLAVATALALEWIVPILGPASGN